MNDPVDIIQVCEALQHRQCNLRHNIYVNSPNLLVYPVERALVHALHANADVGIRDERAVEGDDVLRIAIVHDLQLAQDLLAHRRLRVDEDNLEMSR